MIVTDAWKPQVNGVVRTLQTTARELQGMGHTVEFLTPLEFSTLPCPTYPDIRLSLFAGGKVRRRLSDFDPDALHIATEGPLGLAARRFALRHNLPFSTAYHTRFPEYVRARTGVPLSWTYAFLRWFHRPSESVMAPTEVVRRDLESHGLTNVVTWSRGVDLEIFKPQESERLKSDPPIFLYVGRVAVEKNIEAFLELDLPGSKWVVGVGPALQGIRARHPKVNYLGVLDQRELAQVYASADVFVFPSKTDTFGLVLLEAMACGLPVAAYPVTGPLDVIGDSRTAGVMHEDLRTACLEALKLRREDAAAHARKFSWRAATEQFVAHLHPRLRTAKAPALAGASGA
ncbi:MAG TPA: glycosyltransferase family 1 protein [Steroidobacteraceae bacterium]|nr:glycosyltransferase family 1 protein [Steroidobacteraceae bacterium]